VYTPILFVSCKLWEKAGSLKIKIKILHRRGERKRFVKYVLSIQRIYADEMQVRESKE